MPLITSAGALQSLVDRARRVDHVALDTEFVWERTYYPRLGLIQLGFGRNEVHLVDAPAVDLKPLGELLADSAVIKILHDAEQDLAILSRHTGAEPANIFDTQLAAGFVGLTATISLQALVVALTGIQLTKGATRSDWLQRPLSGEQVEYAREDVRYLPAVYEALIRRLEERGRLEWALEEMQHYERLELYAEEDPRERYRATKGRAKRGFGGRDYAVLQELAATSYQTTR
jgi:ribonuclease D